MAVVALALLGASVVALEARFIYYPIRALAGTPADLGLPYQEATFHAADGVRLHGWFVPGRGPLTWVWCHGNAGNISHRLENIALLRERLGVHVFIFDYRGYGQSAGEPSEQGLYRDAEAALAHVRTLPEVDPERMVLFGRSLGAGVAVELATRQPVRGLILESPFASVGAMARVAFPFLPLGPLLRTRYDTLAKVGQVDVPLLVLHSLTDEVVPYAQGQAVFAAAPEPKWFHAIGGGAGHNDTYLRGGEPYWQALAEFLARLDAPPPR
jgi:fermentation-respiration switch protein FrsA (DUF1100 family)